MSLSSGVTMVVTSASSGGGALLANRFAPLALRFALVDLLGIIAGCPVFQFRLQPHRLNPPEQKKSDAAA